MIDNRGYLKLLFLVEITQFIDNKIESIFKLATKTEEENSLELTAEFLEQLLEAINDLCWLILRIPEDLCSRSLLKKYKKGFEVVLNTLMGLERMWRGIRSGIIDIPRSRDYATCSIFKNMQITALNDLKEQWNDWIDQLRESNDEIKKNYSFRLRSFEQKCHRFITVVFNIFKKIKLTIFVENLSNGLCDELIEQAESIVPLLKEATRLLLIYPHSNLQVCNHLMKLNQEVQNLIECLNLMDEKWFVDSLKEINLLSAEIDGMNPIR